MSNTDISKHYRVSKDIHISYTYLNSLYLKLQLSQSKLSGIRINTMNYILSEKSFDFEVLRVDCTSKEKYYSHFYDGPNGSLFISILLHNSKF